MDRRNPDLSVHTSTFEWNDLHVSVCLYWIAFRNHPAICSVWP